MGTPKTDPDYENSEAALREADAFDAWMLTVNSRIIEQGAVHA